MRNMTEVKKMAKSIKKSITVLSQIFLFLSLNNTNDAVRDCRSAFPNNLSRLLLNGVLKGLYEG